MMGSLTGKAALVTGGSRGIGAAVAARLAQDGADVAITYLSAQDRAATVVSQIGQRGLAIAADSGDGTAVVAAVDQAADHFGRLDMSKSALIGMTRGLARDHPCWR